MPAAAPLCPQGDALPGGRRWHAFHAVPRPPGSAARHQGAARPGGRASKWVDGRQVRRAQLHPRAAGMGCGLLCCPARPAVHPLCCPCCAAPHPHPPRWTRAWCRWRAAPARPAREAWTAWRPRARSMRPRARASPSGALPAAGPGAWACPASRSGCHGEHEPRPTAALLLSGLPQAGGAQGGRRLPQRALHRGQRRPAGRVRGHLPGGRRGRRCGGGGVAHEDRARGSGSEAAWQPRGSAAQAAPARRAAAAQQHLGTVRPLPTPPLAPARRQQAWCPLWSRSC